MCLGCCVSSINEGLEFHTWQVVSHGFCTLFGPKLRRRFQDNEWTDCSAIVRKVWCKDRLYNGRACMEDSKEDGSWFVSEMLRMLQ